MSLPASIACVKCKITNLFKINVLKLNFLPINFSLFEYIKDDCLDKLCVRYYDGEISYRRVTDVFIPTGPMVACMWSLVNLI